MFINFILLLISPFVFAKELTSPIIDQANIFSASERQQLQSDLITLKDNKDVYLVVMTVPTLGREDIESFAERTFREFQIGTAEKDNGVLFVMSVQDRRMRLEIGYGLEGDIPDVVAKRLLDDVVGPQLKQSKYFDGVSQLINSIRQMKVSPQVKARFHFAKRHNMNWIKFTAFECMIAFFSVLLIFVKQTNMAPQGDYISDFLQATQPGKTFTAWEDFLEQKKLYLKIASFLGCLGIIVVVGSIYFALLSTFPTHIVWNIAIASPGVLLVLLLLFHFALMQIPHLEILDCLPENLHDEFKKLVEQNDGLKYQKDYGFYSASRNRGIGSGSGDGFSGGSGSGGGGGFSGGGSSGGGGASSNW